MSAIFSSSPAFNYGHHPAFKMPPALPAPPPQIYVARYLEHSNTDLIFDHKKLIEDCSRQRSGNGGNGAKGVERVDETKSMESFDLDESLDPIRFVHLGTDSALQTAADVGQHVKHVVPEAPPHSSQLSLKAGDSAAAARNSNQSSQCSSLECLSSDEGYVGSYSSSSSSDLVASGRGGHRHRPAGQLPLIQSLLPTSHHHHRHRRQDMEEKVDTSLVCQELEQLISFLLVSSDDHQTSPAAPDDHQHFKVPDMFTAHKAPFEKDSDDGPQGFVNLLEYSSELDRLTTECPVGHCLDDQPVWSDSVVQSDLAHEAQCQRSLANREEFRREDLIDTNAYLNEIEMNMDYFQSELKELYDQNVNSSYWDSDPVSMDSMLTYKSNREAFNLRSYHRNFVLRPEPPEIKANKSSSPGTFDNIQVDSIAEFIPPAQMKLTRPVDDESTTSKFDFEPENGDSTVVIEHETELYEETTNGYYGNKYASGDDTGAYYDQTVAENRAGLGFVLEGEQDSTPRAYETTEGYDENYYHDLEDDYDYDYDFQMLVDSMTEKDALDLLASQSELYALQMAQAAKLGISIDLNPVTDFGDATDRLMDLNELTKPSESVMLESSHSNVDLFENIFSYDEQLVDWTKESGNGKESISSKSSSAWSSLASEQAESNSNLNMSETSESAYPAANTLTPTTSVASNVASLSLRTSLLKLLQTRHHLGLLLKQKQDESCGAKAGGGLMSATSNSSASSSLTNSSIYLNKQSMNNFQQSSKKPCVHKLNDGHCSRADCRFAHDFKNITCKYWLEGECLKGEACEFLHDIVEQPIRSNQGRRSSLSSNSSIIFGGKKGAKKAVKQPDFKLDTEEFPALGGAPVTPQVTISIESEPMKASELTETQPPPIGKTMTLAAKLKSSIEKKAKAPAVAQKTPAISQAKQATPGTLTSSNKMNKMAAREEPESQKPVHQSSVNHYEWSSAIKNENKPCEKATTTNATTVPSANTHHTCARAPTTTNGGSSKKMSNVTIANYGIEILSNKNSNGAKSKAKAAGTKANNKKR